MDKGRLQRQVLGIFGVWLCLVTWIFYDLHLSRQRELSAAERSASTLVKVLEAHLYSSIQKIDFRLQQFVDRYQYAVFSRVRRDIIEPELRTGLAFFPEASSFRVADAAGNYVYDAVGDLASVSIADRDYFRRHKDSRDSGLVISEPIQSRVTGRWVIVLSRRLEDPKGNFAGIVLAALDATYFQNFYASLNLGENSLLALWSRDLRLIARWPNRQEWLGKTLQDTAFNTAISRGETAGSLIVKMPLDGVERLFTFQVADGFPLILVVGQAESIILAEWYRRVVTYAAFCLLLGGALVTLTYVWMRSFRRANTMAVKMSAAFEEKSREARALLDSIPFPAWLLDGDGRFAAVNEAFCRYSQHSMDATLGKTIFDLFTEAEAICLHDVQMDAFRGKASIRREIWLSLSGVKRPFGFLGVPLFRDDGQPGSFTGVAWDLSDRYDAEQRQRLITHVFDHSSEAILILDDQYRVVTFNKAVTDITGYLPEDAQGQRARLLTRGGESDTFFDSVAGILLEERGWRGELAVCRKDGSQCPIFCNATPICDEVGNVVNWALFVNDLSERKATEARLESLANLDQLTKLPNRHGFLRLLTEHLATGKSCAVIFLDLDQLARINDAFGHQAGDLLLTTITGRLRRLLRGEDVLGHLGGGLFGVVVEDSQNLAGLEIVTRKLINSVSHPFQINKADIVPTACAGIAIAPQDGVEASDLMSHADVAMHIAKEHGLSGLRFFDSHMNILRTKRLHMESDLRWALSRQQLVLHYQPQVCVSTGQIVGFESLLRWEHPELGRIPPDHFIPLAEESRLILPIGSWVLREACSQAKSWQDEGYSPTVMAVNISAIQLQDEEFISSVREVLTETGLDPKWLELEITESAIMDKPEQVVDMLEQLKTLGLRLSIDDFGTGYSSLAYLQRFPVDKIKIDRSFIRGIPESSGNAAIARMVIGIARELQRDVIAEGVETLEQLDFLLTNGCDEFQGYYCSPPIPAANIPKFLT